MTSRRTGHTRIQVLYYSDSPTKIEDTTKNRNGCQQLTQGTKESDSHAFVTRLFGISPIDAPWPCAMFFVLAGPITHSISSPPVDTWFHQSGVFRSYFPRRPFEGMICSVHNSYFVLGLPHREFWPCLGQWYKFSITSHSTHDVACEVCLVSEMHQLWLCCVRMLTLINV